MGIQFLKSQRSKTNEGTEPLDQSGLDQEYVDMDDGDVANAEINEEDSAEPDNEKLRKIALSTIRKGRMKRVLGESFSSYAA